MTESPGGSIGGSSDARSRSAAASSAGARSGRRRRRVEGGRKHRHEVKVTPEEEARLLMLAEAAKVSVPRLLIESALAGGAESSAGRREAVAELFSAGRLLASIANNVNQIARVANSTMEVPVETDATLAAVRRVAERVEEAVDALSV